MRAGLTANHPIIAKMALFNPCMKFEFLLSQMTLFEVLKNSPLLIKCLWLRQSAYPSE